MKTHPSCEFFIYDGKTYYNNQPELLGTFSSWSLGVPPGHISLYEYNVDYKTGSNNYSYPYLIKDSSRITFKTVGMTDYIVKYSYGDTIESRYPMSSSIVREFMYVASQSATDGVHDGPRPPGFTYRAGSTMVREVKTPSGRTKYYSGPRYRHFAALKNKLNYYGIRSEHYRISSSLAQDTGFDKNGQIINFISIPSIFYGNKITPGTVSLKWYFTGSLAGELQDLRQNGELIQIGPTGSTESGSVAGIVLYEEGFVLLTGSWALNDKTIPMTADSADTSNPSWIYWGAGCNDGVTQTSTAGGGVTKSDFMSCSFGLKFKGQTNTQVMTMFAHAKRGEVNYSNNPTYLKYGQSKVEFTSSQVYQESASLDIVNMVSSSHPDFSASFQRQVCVSKVAIYDEDKNLIGVATLSNPILKEEDQDLSFKIRLDI